jgi:hypothetical protein
MLGCRHRGWPAMRSTAPTPGGGPSCRPASSARCWRSPATTGSAWVAAPAGSTSCTPRVPARAWRRGSAGAAPRATAWTTGRLRAWTTVVPTSQPGRTPLAAGAPSPRHRRAGLVSLLHAPTDPAGGPGQGRRAALDHPSALPGPARAGAAWTSTRFAAALLGPLGDPGHGCPRLPGRCRPGRASPRSRLTRADRGVRQPGQPPVRRPGRPARRAITPTGWPGRGGGDAIRCAPGPATTADKPPSTHEATGCCAVARGGAAVPASVGGLQPWSRPRLRTRPC